MRTKLTIQEKREIINAEAAADSAYNTYVAAEGTEIDSAHDAYVATTKDLNALYDTIEDASLSNIKEKKEK